jgi:hypothetical protein
MDDAGETPRTYGVAPSHFAATRSMEARMSCLRNLLFACSLVLTSAGFAHAEDCGPRDINGKKYTCCKKSTQNLGAACDANVKVGEALRCGEKIETKYECTEVSANDKKVPEKDKQVSKKDKKK